MTPDDLAAASPSNHVRAGRYDVTGLIRAGGMGTVYDAIDREHGTRVALKTLTHIAIDGLPRFKTEFRAVADLSHPNLVPVYELSCHEGLWFFTMERIDGADFLTALCSPGAIEPTPLPTTRVEPTGDDGSFAAPSHVEDAPALPPSIPALRGALAQLVRGVRELHHAGLLHLDLKPSNVLVEPGGRLVIVDFGLVRAIGESGATPSTTVVGTPGWMAPEQAAIGVRVSEATDWYAVGLLLYVALTGRPAFPGTRAQATNAQRNDPPPRPDELVPGCPPDLSALTMELLASEPAMRPSGDRLAATFGGDDAGAAPARARSELVGRGAERGLLRDALEIARRGETSIVHLTGPSGVGKSALLDRLADDASVLGALVLRGRCYERETVPYKAFDGMIDELAVRLAALPTESVVALLPPWIAELAQVFPALASVPAVHSLLDDAPRSSTLAASELRRRAIEALRELLLSLTRDRPFVLAIDDLQWADADSAALLVKLLSPPPPARMLLAVSFRPAEASSSAALALYFDALRAVERRRDAHVVSVGVGPLARADATRLAGAILGALGVRSEGLAAALADEAAGVPFFVEELAHFAAERRGEPGAPSGISLEDVLERRVRALPRDQRALVEVLSVANKPIPVATSFAVAGIEMSGPLRALWSLRAGQFVRSTGERATDRVDLHHDRMRQSVLTSMPPARIDELHLALGRALAARDTEDERGAWLFDAIRHLNDVPHLLSLGERVDVARLNLRAGLRARRAAAFPLAFECFHAGAKLLAASAWDDDYQLALALHGGAAEMATLSAAWRELDAHVAIVKARARTARDQVVAWEAEIDAAIARVDYSAAVDAALSALALLGVELPRAPGEAEVGAEVERAMAALASVGPAGLSALPNADDEIVAAAMRLMTRVGSAAYFARPLLFPLLACRMVVTSVERGLSPATPFALSVYGVVLSTLGMLPEAHAWGAVARALLERFDDRSLAARTLHVVHDLVCTWTVPLAGTLDDLRGVVAIGREAGDFEYAGYAAHAYVHNAFYAGRPLEPLLADALAYGELLRAWEQENALHVHAPFEQIIRCFTGRTRDPARLDGDGFDEAAALEAARSTGSRSAQHIIGMLMGIVRYHFGDAAEASAFFEAARPFLDGVASTWHVPIFHQYAALAIHRLPTGERAALRARADESLSALDALAAHGPENFSHRVDLVLAEKARADGDLGAALDGAARAIRGAERGFFWADLVLGHELSARCRTARGDLPESSAHADAADAAYARWGARAKVARPTLPGAPPDAPRKRQGRRRLD